MLDEKTAESGALTIIQQQAAGLKQMQQRL